MLEGTWHGKTFNISAWSGFSFPRCVAGFINKPGFFISFLITVWELLIPNLICIGRIVTGGICLVLHIFSILNAFFFFFARKSSIISSKAFVSPSLVDLVGCLWFLHGY